MAVMKRTYVDFRATQPAVTTSAVGQIGVVTNQATNFFQAGGATFECYVIAQNDDIIPTKILDANGNGGTNEGASGWQIPNDNADNDGVEIGQGVLADRELPNVFKVGTHGAFQISVKFSIPNVSDYDVCAVGFRLAEAYQDVNDPSTDLQSAVLYKDFALLNVEAGDIKTMTTTAQTGGGTGTSTETDTTDNWADDEAHTLTVKVSAAGVVTFEIDGSAPTVNTNTLTFVDGDLIIPCMIFTKGAAVTDTPPILQTYYCGLQ